MSQEGASLNDIQGLLNAEFQAVKKYLDEISRDQAILNSATEKMSVRLGNLLDKCEVRLSKCEERPSFPRQITLSSANTEPLEDYCGASLNSENYCAAFAKASTIELDTGRPSGGESSQLRRSSVACTKPDTFEQDTGRPSSVESSQWRSSSVAFSKPDKFDRSSWSQRTSAIERKQSKSIRESSTLQYLSRIAEVDKDTRKNEKRAADEWENASLFRRLMLLSVSTKDLILEAAIGGVIVSNAIFIGVSADHWGGEINIYSYIDVTFGVIFLMELGLKLHIHGFIKHFNGKDRISNCFDLTLVVLDTLQLLLVFVAKDANKQLENEGVPSASLFRVVRVMRVTRILRLLRLSFFETLLKMVEGVVFGEITLLWALVLFSGVVYVGALLCKDAFGDEQQHVELHQHFNSVPRSMYTVFRCSFGDCDTDQGRPIPEYIHKYYGGLASVGCCLFFFFITIGLFNVISAIFVDSTMARAAEKQSQKLVEKLADDNLWCKNVCVILRECLKQQSLRYEEELEQSNGCIEKSMLLVKFTPKLIHEVFMYNPEAKSALENLQIESTDHGKLADMLDPNHSGNIESFELVNGLHRLRGNPRRSDIVNVDLMLRATQKKLDDMHLLLDERFDYIRSQFKRSRFSM